MVGLMRSPLARHREDPRLLRLSQLPRRPPSRLAITPGRLTRSRGNPTTRARDADPLQAPQRPSRNTTSADQSVVEQLHALYAEREDLVKSLGTADAASLIERVKDLETTVASLVEQVHSFYAEREEQLASAT
jgi:hypothetical protein